jgi:hypothetical protein
MYWADSESGKVLKISLASGTTGQLPGWPQLATIKGDNSQNRNQNQQGATPARIPKD